MAETPSPAPAAPARRSPAPIIALCVVLGGGAIYGVRQWLWGRTHTATDDAYLTGSLVNVSPAIGGTLAELKVQEGDPVQAGELLARLDDASQQAALRQAEANLVSARSQVVQAEANLRYQAESADAAIARARAGDAIQSARAAAAAAQREWTRRATLSQLSQAERAAAAAHAQAAQAEAQALAAQAQVAQVEAQLATGQAALQGARRAAVAARKGVDALQARIAGADADAEKTARDEARYRALLEKDAVTRQQADAVHAQAEAARSNRAALREQVAQADAQAGQADAAVAQAEAQLKAVEAQVQQALAAHAAARRAAQALASQAQVADSGVGVARANRMQVGVQSANVDATLAQAPQVRADVVSAEAGRAQTDAKREAVRASRAMVAQAEAQVAAAQKNLDNTRLVAHRPGIVLKKAANPGASLSPGQTLLTITQGDVLWLTANYKETQVRDLRLGQPVEIAVDALPGQTFHGRIAVIGAATGATVSLLPPDNATGNFTKVVQRIPVKIAIEGERKGLRQGMSCTATVDTAEREDHPERIPAGWDGRAGEKTP